MSNETIEQRLADIRIAVTLMHHAMELLTAVTREVPRMDLGIGIAGLNRQILAMQGNLIAQEREILKGQRP